MLPVDNCCFLPGGITLLCALDPTQHLTASIEHGSSLAVIALHFPQADVEGSSSGLGAMSKRSHLTC